MMSLPHRAALLLLVLGTLRAAPAAATRTLAVVPAEAVNVGVAEVRRYAEQLRRALAGAARLEIVAAARVDSALAALPGGCAQDLLCLRRLGRQLAVGELVLLEVARLGDTLALRIKAFDVAREQYAGAWQELLRTVDDRGVAAALGRMAIAFSPPPPVATKPWYRRWWVWTAAGAVVAGSTVAIVLATRSPAPDLTPRPDLTFVLPAPTP
jgi:hypothetical protein